MKVDSTLIREVLRTKEYELHFLSLEDRVKIKYDYVIQLIQTQRVISKKFVKKIQNTELYEVRVSVGTNEHRTMLIAVDNPNFIEATRVILINSFLKKDSKQYKKEIEKAKTIIEKEGLI